MREEDTVAEVNCSQPTAEAVTMDTLQVKDEMHQTLDTAVNLPLGPASATQSAMDIRPQLLQSMLVVTPVAEDTSSQVAAQSTRSTSNPVTMDVNSQQKTQPNQILDRCLAQALAAKKILDRLSASQARRGKNEKAVDVLGVRGWWA